MKKIKLFTYVRTAIDNYVKNDDSDSIWKRGVNAGFTVAPSVVFMLISILFFFVFIFYFFVKKCRTIFKCFCRLQSAAHLKVLPGDSADVKESKRKERIARVKLIEHETRPVINKIILISSLVFSVIVIALIIPWAIAMFKAIDAVEKNDCAVYYTFENIREGVNTNEIDFKFPGIKGMKFFVNEMRLQNNHFFDKTLQDYEGFVRINDQNLVTKSNEAFATLKIFYDLNKSNKVKSCAGDGT
jgi:hypothetical protein